MSGCMSPTISQYHECQGGYLLEKVLNSCSPPVRGALATGFHGCQNCHHRNRWNQHYIWKLKMSRKTFHRISAPQALEGLQTTAFGPCSRNDKRNTFQCQYMSSLCVKTVKYLQKNFGTVDTGIGEASISRATQWFRPCETGISFGMATF